MADCSNGKQHKGDNAAHGAQSSCANAFSAEVSSYWTSLSPALARAQSQDQNGPIPDLSGTERTNLQGINGLKTEVKVDATVVQLLPDFNNPRNGLKHEQFIVRTDDGKDEFVAHDLNFAPRVPLTVGEKIQLKAEWIPTPDLETHGGTQTIGVLHWTHHSESEQKHPSGYIEAGGQIYK